MMIQYGLFQPMNEVIDPLGSIIINTNTNQQPILSWVLEKYYKTFGPPDIQGGEIINSIPNYHDTVSYKINFLENIFDPQDDSFSIGSSDCLIDPTSVNCAGKGPFRILNKRYYIDFRIFYIVNKTIHHSGDPLDNSIFSPILSLDFSRCTEDYGFFIAAPKPKENENSSVPHVIADSSNDYPLEHRMFVETPRFTNHLGVLNSEIKYRLTVLNDGTDSNSYWDNVALTPNNIVLAVQKAITQGQTSIVSATDANNAIVLYPQTANFPHNVNPKSYYPFILFRYVSANAATRRIIFSFSFAPNFTNNI